MAALTRTITVPMRVDIRYGTNGPDGTFRESLTSKIDRTIGFGVRRGLTLAAMFGAGLVAGWLL